MSDTVIIVGGDRRLSAEQQRMWEPLATAMGLSPYICKALYVCGLLRQRLEAAGLTLANGCLLDAQSSAFGAIELLGQCVGGIEEVSRVTWTRYEAALSYLATLGPTDELPEFVDLSAAGVFRLRNFIDHGAAAIEPDTRFTLPSIVWLLRRLARALDHFWSADGDSDHRQECFSRATVVPMWARGANPPGAFVPFVEDMQIVLALYGRLGAPLRFESSWRTDDDTNFGATGSASSAPG
jgi:hypothetical protein